MTPTQLATYRVTHCIRNRFETRCVSFSAAGFETQCVSNLEHAIELPHLAQIGHVKTATERLDQAPRQHLQHRLAVGCAPLAALFMLHNQAPHLPVSVHHR